MGNFTCENRLARIPYLSFQLRPWSVDAAFQQKCKAVKDDTSLRLIVLTKQACETRLNHLSDVIHAQERSLDESFAESTDRLEECEGERVRKVKDMKWDKLLTHEDNQFKEVSVNSDGN